MTLKKLVKIYRTVVRNYSKGTGCSIQDAELVIMPYMIKLYGKRFKTLEKRLQITR